MIFQANLHKLITWAIVIGIVLVILLAFVGAVGEQLFPSIKQTQCKASVEGYAKLLTFYDASQEYALSCPFHEVELKSSKAYNVLAEEMYTCWNNYGAGDLVLAPSSSDVFCSVCAVIRPEENIDLQGLHKYLAETPVAIGGKSYAASFADIHYNGVVYPSDTPPVSLAANQDYSLIFVSLRDLNAWETYTLQKSQMTFVSVTQFESLTVVSNPAGNVVHYPSSGSLTNTEGPNTVRQFMVDGEQLTSHTEILLTFATKDRLEALGCSVIPAGVLT